MLANFLGSGDLFSQHWHVVAVASAVFFILQLGLCVRVAVRARRRRELLEDYAWDWPQAGDNRPQMLRENSGFAWLDWVMLKYQSLPAKVASTAASNFRRDDLLHELDAHLAAQGDYLLLQRMGVMAPLLGVILTVVGFYMLTVDETSAQSLSSILSAVTPLISGVGAGALLALVNQALLHVASVRLDQVRMAARRWLDVVLASLSDRANESAGDMRSTATLERAMTSLAEAMHRSRGSSDRVERSTASLERAAAQLEQTIQSFSAEMFAIPEALLNLQKSMAASANAMEELIPVGQRAVANLDVSVAAFRTTVDREFADAAKAHWQSSQQLAASAQRTSNATELLREASDGTFALKGLLEKYAAMIDDVRQAQETTSRTIEGLSAAGERLRQSVEGEMGPAQRMLRESADSFAKSATELSQFVETGLGPAIEPLGELHHTLKGLKEALAAVERFSKLRGEIDRLSTSLALAADNAGSLAALPEQVRRAVETNLNHHRPRGRGRLRTWLGGRPR